MEKEKKYNLVERLYRYRVEQRLTLKQLADDLDLPLTTISNWLQRNNYPSDIAAEALSKYLSNKGY